MGSAASENLSSYENLVSHRRGQWTSKSSRRISPSTLTATRATAAPNSRAWGVMKLLLLACASLCAAQSIAIKTGMLIDGKGGVQRNVVVSVEGSKIARIEPAGAPKSTY